MVVYKTQFLHVILRTIRILLKGAGTHLGDNKLKTKNFWPLSNDVGVSFTGNATRGGKYNEVFTSVETRYHEYLCHITTNESRIVTIAKTETT